MEVNKQVTEAQACLVGNPVENSSTVVFTAVLKLVIQVLVSLALLLRLKDVTVVLILESLPVEQEMSIQPLERNLSMVIQQTLL